MTDNSDKNKTTNSLWKKGRKLVFHSSGKFDPKIEAGRICVIYLLLGILIVTLSHQLLIHVVTDLKMAIWLSILKDGAYLCITGVAMYSLVYATFKRNHQDELKINLGYQQLVAAYEELEFSKEEIMASEEELKEQFDALSESQRLLLDSEERYRLVSEATNDGIWEERDNKRYYSERWLEITGYERDEINGTEGWRNLIHPEDYKITISKMEEHIQNQTPFYSCEYRLRCKAGNYKWIQTRGKARFDENGKAYRIAGSHTDITNLKEYQMKLHDMAYHDYMTGLPNRSALYAVNLTPEDMNSISKSALLFIDIDNLKYINDTRGHSFGDQFIKALSKRVLSHLNNRGDIYCVGGDDFIVVLKDIKKLDEVDVYANELLEILKEPFQIGDSVLHIVINVGVAIFPEHGGDTKELLRCADIAMYKAKELGGNRYTIYDYAMKDVLNERMLIEKHLDMALEKKEFTLHYQPQYDLIEKKITGLEALLRWKNSELGSVSPNIFIPIAEDTRMIIPLGTWVIREACAFTRRLHNQGRTDITVSINISILQILQDDFVDLIREILEENQLQPQSIELEITESILMKSFDTISDKLNLLFKSGIKIALDDFGKGYSSLSYLKQLPISTLKIDKSFVDCITIEEGNKFLAGQIVTMGKSMGLSVVAEGVETEEQFDYLAQHNCQKIQGYLFSRPVPEEDIEKMMTRNQNSRFM